MSHDLREKLRSAIEKYHNGIAAAEKAKETLERAEAFVSDLESDVGNFKALDKEIAASRAESIERAIIAGETPTFDAVPELAAELIKKNDAENKLKAAGQAVVALAEKVEAANQLIARLDMERDWAAEEVLAAEAHADAIAFNEKVTDLRREFYRLSAIRNQTVRVDPKTRPAPAYPGQHVPTVRHIEISQDVKNALEEVGVLGRHEERHGLAMGEEIARGVESHFRSLRDDASATFEEAML